MDKHSILCVTGRRSPGRSRKIAVTEAVTLRYGMVRLVRRILTVAFNDVPASPAGCVIKNNSAALDSFPYDELEEQG